MSTTAIEQQELARHEAIIERGLKSFVEVGTSLLAIRDGRLYRNSHKTFEDYCQERWGIARQTAYQYIDAADVVGNVRNCGQIPQNEAQARPLAKLKTPEQQRQAWQQAVETAPDGKPTAAHVAQVVRSLAREPKPEPAVLPAPRSPRLIVGRAENVPEIDSESVDLIITSPPYNMGADNWPMGGDGRTPRQDGIGYDDQLPESLYQSWQLDVLSELFRVARLGASLFYNHKPRNRNGRLIHPMAWLGSDRNPWIMRQEIVWDRGSTHNHSPALFWPQTERIYWLTKGDPVLPSRPIGIPDIWRFHGPVANTWHPAPFGEELPRRCIEAIGRSSIMILDPFAGSCTTLKVALEFGFDAIGIVMSAEYLDRARRENGWTAQKETSRALKT